MMKLHLCIFVLVVSVAAFGQGRSGGGGHMSGQHSGSMGAGSTGADRGSMGADHGSMSTTRGNEDNTMGHGSRDMSKQPPDTALSRNPQLSSRLDSMLPKGTSAQQACSGFKNLGQCVAAIHVAKNLDIPFSDLKSKMTGQHAEKLGKAIHTLKPEADAKAEAKKAEKQAKKDLSPS